MNVHKKNGIYTIGVFILSILSGCSSEFLNIKPDKALVVPKKLDDFEALMRNFNIMTEQNAPYYGEVAADDYFLTDNSWETLSQESLKNAYVWAEDIYGSASTEHQWNRPYQTVFYANVALEGAMGHAKSPQRDRVEGAARFHRAWIHYLMLNTFAKQYDPATANSDWGIPLRLVSDTDIPTKRATVQESYDQIIEDLTIASELLPNLGVTAARASKHAAYTLLSRVMLQIENYAGSLEYADKALAIKGTLMDYRLIDTTLSSPFEQMNEEVVYRTNFSAQPLSQARLQVDPGLYQSYVKDDLRRSLYFFDNGGILTFKGSYDGFTSSTHKFAGMAMDELYLMKAECHARLGQPDAAMETLNHLLKYRFNDNFIPLQAIDADEALILVLEERRKELVFRGIRWFDLKRLNRDPRFAKTLTRTVSGLTYSLEPQSPRYVFPLPPDVIELGNYPQNER